MMIKFAAEKRRYPMNAKKIFLLVLGFIFAYNLQPSVLSPLYAVSEKAPKIKIITKDSDLGRVEKNKIYDFKIEVKNIGIDDLVITNVSSNCGCLELTDKRWPNVHDPVASDVNIEPVIINKGNSIYISARVDTNKVGDEFEKMIHIFSNDPENKDVVWTVRGNKMFEAKPRTEEDVRGFASNTNIDAKVIMLFYSPGCNECREIMDNFLPEIKQKYKDKIMVVDYNIENMESYAFMLSLQDQYDENSKGGFYNPKPPILFIENRLLYGVKDIEKKLEGIIEGKNG